MCGEEAVHIPVMAGPVIEWLALRPDGHYVDATAGAGGHAARLAAQLSTGRLIAVDRDPSAVARVRERFASDERVDVRHGNYGELKAVLAAAGICDVDGVLIDAGCSSMQLDTPDRGFSFQTDGPLDMRMDSSSGATAAGYLASVTEPELAQVLRDFGDVRPARRIAKAILARRGAGRLKRTNDLAAAVREALDFVRGEPDEIRTVFQAIRIAVNQELKWLDAGLRSAVSVLRPGGRLVVLSFHSAEDRVVKAVFRELSRPRRERYPDGREKVVHPAVIEVLTRRPLLPSEEEVRRNPRAKSAKLRAAARRSV